jgi:hypothetical protein
MIWVSPVVSAASNLWNRSLDHGESLGNSLPWSFLKQVTTTGESLGNELAVVASLNRRRPQESWAIQRSSGRVTPWLCVS